MDMRLRTDSIYTTYSTQPTLPNHGSQRVQIQAPYTQRMKWEDGQKNTKKNNSNVEVSKIFL